MKKAELVKLIEKELEYVKANQSFSDFEEAKENIACETFAEEDWCCESNAMDSLEETLNYITVVEDDSESVAWFIDMLKRGYGYDTENPETLDDVEEENLVNDIQTIRSETIYLSDYREFWTEF